LWGERAAGLPHPNPLTAEQKEDIRTYLRHLPPVVESQKRDQLRMVEQLRSQFGEVKERAKLGEPKALKKWGELVSWTNKLQDLSLKNNANALAHLLTISQTNLFSPRFRTAS
jgi:hypothetical protein